jgi:uncharacterized membrane protein
MKGRKLRSLPINVSEAERWASILGGGYLYLKGWLRGGPIGFMTSLLGGGLILRGYSGHCPIYEMRGKESVVRGGSADVSVPYKEGYQFQESVVVDASPEKLYAFWRNLENLPRIMRHVESVTMMKDGLSHWVVKGPPGVRVEWDGEVINEVENELIGWRSLPGADVNHAGSVHFEEVPGGTKVTVVLRYVPPGGALGKAIARLFGTLPKEQVREDLQNFKTWMETGKNPLEAKKSSGAASAPQPAGA